MKKFWALLLTAAMTMSLLTGCGGSGSDTGSSTNGTGTEEQAGQSGDSAAADVSDSAADESEEAADLDMSQTVKMGILVSDATTAEALAFRNYYTEYIQKQYNVEMIYSDELTDAAGETSAIDTFITNNCKAIISFSSFDRAAQIEQCEEAGVYYAVATGTLTDEEYETYKGYEHYVGAIGPSLDVEFETGYNMAKHYLDQGAIIGQIFTDGEVKIGAIGDVNILGYVGGYDMDDAWFGKCAQMAQTADLEVILAVGNGSDFFGTAISGTDVKIASVDAYASSYGEAMEAGMLDYLAGKFSASIGPIFIATYRAALGSPVRTTDGNALALSQGYWVAAGADEFNTYYAVDSSVDSPAYTKEMLDTLLTADYAAFESFVGKYSFEEIQGM